jgi:hypothetical protein
MGRTPSIPVSVIIFRTIAGAAIRCIDQAWSSAWRRVSITARSPAQSMKETGQVEQ